MKFQEDLFIKSHDEYCKEIARTQEIADLDSEIVSELRGISMEYCIDLAQTQGSMKKYSVKDLGNIYAEYAGRVEQINNRSGHTIWNPDNFLWTTMQIVEPRAIENISKRGLAINESHREKLTCDCPGKCEGERIKSVLWRFYNYPSVITTAAREVYTIMKGDFSTKHYEKSLDAFDIVGNTIPYKKGSRIIPAYQRTIRQYIADLKENVGNIEGMANVIANGLQQNTNKFHCGPREFYIDPFFPDDLSKVQFPSIQADFVAARLMAQRIDKGEEQ